jgi:hypothetical protein
MPVARANSFSLRVHQAFNWLRKLEAVELIATEGDYTFIYISSVMAHAIPHDRVTDGNRQRS